MGESVPPGSVRAVRVGPGRARRGPAGDPLLVDQAAKPETPAMSVGPSRPASTPPMIGPATGTQA